MVIEFCIYFSLNLTRILDFFNYGENSMMNCPINAETFLFFKQKNKTDCNV